VKSNKRDLVQVADLPTACRTWDDRRRGWTAKKRYAASNEAQAAAKAGGPKLEAYPCPSKAGGAHFHVGSKKGRR
jgi:hypothetical protein